MKPYGSKKRKHKIHPHNECAICAEVNFGKGSARAESKKIINNSLKEKE